MLTTLDDHSLQALLDICPDAMVLVDPSGTIVMANHQVEAVFGYAASDLVGQSVEMLIPERLRKSHHGNLPRFFANPSARRMGSGMSLFGKRKDDTEFDADITLSPVETRHGPVVAAAIRDLTATKQAQRRFERLLDSAPDATIVIDSTGTIVRANARVKAIFGYLAHELIGEPVETLLPERFRERHVQHILRFFTDPAARPMGSGMALFGLHRDGTEFDAEISLSPIETDESLLVAASVRDVTEKRELARSNSELEQFAYIASHDLQEPLRMVASYTELLRRRYEGHLDEKADKYIGYAVEGAKRMQGLIDDLLAYSRAGAQDRQMEEVDSSEAFDAALSNLAVALNRSAGRVTRTNLPTITADRAQLVQLFQNLLGNALKFARPEIPPQIHVSARANKADWIFSVQDNGIGIEQEYSDRIFRMFQRLHLRADYEGNGIGLAIVQRIVRRHGGRLWVESKPGEGSTFYFALPATARHSLDESPRERVAQTA